MSDFRPRWYYILINNSSGKKYVGQTVQENMDGYCGSGVYWVKHCKKHGGWDRANVQVLEQTWLADRDAAQKWLDDFGIKNNGYWLKENSEWANACKETTLDSSFAGLTDEQRKEYGRLGGKIAVESGQLASIASKGGKITGTKCAESGHMAKMSKIAGKAGASLGGKAAGKKAVESGRWEKCQIEGNKTRGRNLRLLSQFCKIFNITSPGVGFGKIDKAAFQLWKSSLPQTVGPL